MSVFKKGEEVVCISNWDSKGTVTIQNLIVHSCGKKVLRLMCPVTGETRKCAIVPEVATVDDVGYFTYGVFKFIPADEAIATAFQVAQRFLDSAVANFNYRKEKHAGDAGFCAAMDNQLAQLHETRVFVEVGNVRTQVYLPS